MTLWTTSPIKAKNHTVLGYAVAQGHGKDRRVAIIYKLSDGHTPETAYEAASDTAKLLNIAAE